MKYTKWVSLIVCGIIMAVSSDCYARGRRPVTNTVSAVAHAVDHKLTRTAQGVAEIMARLGTVGHFGGNPGYEGCGMGATKEQAYSICCYGNSGMQTVDVGYAQGTNGMWYCCRRYK